MSKVEAMFLGLPTLTAGTTHRPRLLKGSPLPSCERNAICFPSGDQRGSVSWPGRCTSVRTLPSRHAHHKQIALVHVLGRAAMRLGSVGDLRAVRRPVEVGGDVKLVPFAAIRAASSSSRYRRHAGDCGGNFLVDDDGFVFRLLAFGLLRPFPDRLVQQGERTLAVRRPGVIPSPRQPRQVSFSSPRRRPAK